jgi:hypothetical protein
MKIRLVAASPRCVFALINSSPLPDAAERLRTGVGNIYQNDYCSVAR